jgi:hypothetical protein
MDMDKLTTEEHGLCFRLLDEYARSKHSCFISEFFSPMQSGSYTICFRSLGSKPNDSDNYSCKYLQLNVGELRKIVSEKSVPVVVAAKLDAALPTLQS